MADWGLRCVHQLGTGCPGPSGLSARRRLLLLQRSLDRIVRADIAERGEHRIETDDAQVTVVDLHNLPDRAKRFVVGVTLRRAFDRKEQTGTAKPLLFVVLDELNKYAPRDGESPIKEILLDVAERGRSLGIVLIGAQQTASEVERRIIGNSSIRVVGRLDPAEAARPEYGFLPTTHQKRATIAKPGTMFVMQPEIPVPLVAEFPFPAWATRPSERGATNPAATGAAAHPRRSLRRAPGRVRILHTSDWHVGKTLRGASRLDEHRAVLAEIAAIAADEAVDLVLVTGDLFESAAPPPEAQRSCGRRCSRCGRPARTSSRSAATTTISTRSTRSRRCSARPASRCSATPTRPERGGVVDGRARRAKPRRSSCCRSCRSGTRSAPSRCSSSTRPRRPGLYTERMRLLIAALARASAPTRSTSSPRTASCAAARSAAASATRRRSSTTASRRSTSRSANYIALGHLHRTQRMPAPAPAWYAGSPIQVDFGEEQDTKHVLVVDAEAGVPAQVEVRELTTPWTLRTVRGTLDELRAPARHGRRRVAAGRRAGSHPAGLADEVRGVAAPRGRRPGRRGSTRDGR